MKELVYRLINGDSAKVLPVLIDRGENSTYDLCVTSPPYWDLVKYNSGDGDLSMMRTEEEFEANLTHIFKCVSRLLSESGTLAIQWEDKTQRPDGRTGEYMLYSLHRAAEEAGVVLYARYIWKKFTKKPSVMYCTYDMAQSRLGRPNPNWSYLFVYKKDVVSKMSLRKTEVTKEEWSKYADAVWDFSNPGVEIHDTPYAPELVRRVLKIYTAPGDKVIDPFLGSGTTMMVCNEMNRSCTGIELGKKYIPGIKERVGWGNQSIEYRKSYVSEGI